MAHDEVLTFFAGSIDSTVTPVLQSHATCRVINYTANSMLRYHGTCLSPGIEGSMLLLQAPQPRPFRLDLFDEPEVTFFHARILGVLC